MQVLVSLIALLYFGRGSNGFITSPRLMNNLNAYNKVSTKNTHLTMNIAKPSLTFLEGNSWFFEMNGVKILLDPVFGTLDFGIPILYSAEKKVLDNESLYKEFVPKANYLLITQGFEDHCHAKTLERLCKIRPDLEIVAPPSAVPLLSKYFNPGQITSFKPGQYIYLFKSSEKPVLNQLPAKSSAAVEILATSGALLGPPWQAKENGYILRGLKAGGSTSSSSSSSSSDRKPGLNYIEGNSVYIEPHCMYDEGELRAAVKGDGPVKHVITPVISQTLPGSYTLVDGGEKALKLAKLLEAEVVVPMCNGDLDARGILNEIIEVGGSVASFEGLVQRESGGTAVAARKKISVADVAPGKLAKL